MLIEKAAAPIVFDLLEKDSFYKSSHRKIFGAMHHLFTHNNPIDLLTVTDELRNRGELEACGGASEVTDLTNRVTSAANVEFHCRIILQKEIQRSILATSSMLMEETYNESDPLELLDRAAEIHNRLIDRVHGVKKQDIKGQTVNTLKDIQAAAKTASHMVGVPCGLRDIDEMTGGWRKGRLYILAARPGMGKTTLALQFAKNQAIKQKIPGIFFSLESGADELIVKLLANGIEYDSDKLSRGYLPDAEWAKLNDSAEEIYNSPLIIDDTPGININQLIARVKRDYDEGKCEWVMVDYLQLITVSNEESYNKNRDTVIGEITKKLKKLSKQLNIPVIALSQLNRSSEDNHNKIPTLRDLRESGNIEQDSDFVAFLYRPEYYDFLKDKENRDLRGIARFMCKKHRGGKLFDIDLKFQPEFSIFSNGSGMPNDLAIRQPKQRRQQKAPIALQAETPLAEDTAFKAKEILGPNDVMPW